MPSAANKNSKHNKTGSTVVGPVFAFFTLAKRRVFLYNTPAYHDYMMAKSEKAFRLAALLRSKTALLFCHILIAMSIGRMIF